MLGTLAFLLALPIALAIALPAICDLALWLRGLGRPEQLPVSAPRPAKLLFLIPAHDEELLIERSVRSLCAQSFPRSDLTVAVIADNCTDSTASLARAAGATVLERQSETHRGKHHAIEWALTVLPWQDYDAVVVIDADTIVEPDYSTQLSRWPDLAERALQTYDHLSNERENSLTRLAGLLTRTRYDIALPLKSRAGLSVPMTGDGIVLGREILKRFPWHIQTITEGWELYTRFSIGGEVVRYEPRSRLYAQETRSLDQSRSQRERWTAGRLGVLKLYWRAIVSDGRLNLLQRLDLLAELMSLGPIVRAVIGLTGTAVAAHFGTIMGYVLAGLFLTGFLQPSLYSVLIILRHPEPGRTVAALAYLPFYAIWRIFIAIRGLLKSGIGSAWTRTGRRAEGGSRTG